jgi:hypothetical protein
VELIADVKHAVGLPPQAETTPINRVHPSFVALPWFQDDVSLAGNTFDRVDPFLAAQERDDIHCRADVGHVGVDTVAAVDELRLQSRFRGRNAFTVRRFHPGGEVVPDIALFGRLPIDAESQSAAALTGGAVWNGASVTCEPGITSNGPVPDLTR